MLHQKADGIAAAATAKAFVYFLGWRYRKGRRFFIMERTEPHIIGAALFQFHEAANNINDIDTALNLLYGVLRNQSDEKSYSGLHRPGLSLQR